MTDDVQQSRLILTPQFYCIMMFRMRTTVTLDSDVDQMLKAEMRRSGATFRQAVNQAIRRGLADSCAVKRKAFRLRPRRLSLRQGIDPAMLQHYEEDLEIEAFLSKTRKLGKR